MYPFGMVMQGRSFSIQTRYRYGFNGKELDADIFEGVIAFEARIFDVRIFRFMSLDPRLKEYPWQTPYAYYKNSPIVQLDFFGMGGPYEENNNSIDQYTMNNISSDSKNEERKPPNTSRNSNDCRDDKRLQNWRNFRYKLKNGTKEPSVNGGRSSDIQIRRFSGRGSQWRNWNPTYIENNCNTPGAGAGPAISPPPITGGVIPPPAVVVPAPGAWVPPVGGGAPPPGTGIVAGAGCILLQQATINSTAFPGGVVGQVVNFTAPPGATTAIITYTWQDLAVTTGGVNDNLQNALTITNAANPITNWNWNNLTATQNWAVPTGNGNNISLTVNIAGGVPIPGLIGNNPDQFTLTVSVCWQ